MYHYESTPPHLVPDCRLNEYRQYRSEKDVVPMTVIYPDSGEYNESIQNKSNQSVSICSPQRIDTKNNEIITTALFMENVKFPHR